MPGKCCVPMCRSNYDNTNEYISVFKFPKEESMRDIWLKKIPRKDFKIGNRTVVCIKHFREDDVITFDELPENGNIIKMPRKHPKLKKDAYPRIFTGCPNYLSEKNTISRFSRDQKLKAADEKTFQNFMKADFIASLEQLKSGLSKKISEYNVAENLYTYSRDDCVFIVFIDFTFIPKIKGSVKIDKNLFIYVFIDKNEISISHFEHLLDSVKHLNSWASLENILRKVHSFCHENDENISNDYYAESIEMWDKHILSCSEENLYSNKHFLREQMMLSSKSKFGKRYSTDLLIFSFSLFINSPVMYKYLYESNMLSLPSVDTLKRLNPFKINECLLTDNNCSYIKMKSEKLNVKDKLVNLLIDEMHVKPNITYKGKAIMGFAENAPLSEATSIQTFMISSIFSNYKEVVCLVPVSKMTTADLYEFTCQVLKVLENAGFDILCIISDNNRINRNTFEKIAGNKTFNHAVKNPVNNSKSLFLLFDTVHLIKSVRNNWINQSDVEKTFQYPDFGDFSNVRNAHFGLLRRIFKLESHCIVKYAPKLSYKTMYPKTIERQNVNLALNVFDERNVFALEIYAKQNSSFVDWKDTAEFLILLKKWWDIVNVSHLKKGVSTHNENSKPFESITDSRLLFLEKFSNWLKLWKEMNQKGRSGCLTNETYFALQHTTSTIVLIIKHLLQNGASFVLTSKFQTDNLEARFGQYRQMSGANYHVSVQQILESERKLRIKSILTLHSSKHGDIPLREFLSSITSNDDTNAIDISPFISLLGDIDLDVISKEETDILIYIAGYCTFKLHLKCTNCMLNFLSSDSLSIEWDDIPAPSPDTGNYLSMVNRGGLKVPSSFVIEIVSYCYSIFQKLLSKEYEILFINSKSRQHSLFVKLVETHFCDIQIIAPETCAECKQDIFDNVKKIISIFGNICLNNYTKVMTDKQGSENDVRKFKKFKKLE